MVQFVPKAIFVGFLFAIYEHSSLSSVLFNDTRSQWERSVLCRSTHVLKIFYFLLQDFSKWSHYTSSVFLTTMNWWILCLAWQGSNLRPLDQDQQNSDALANQAIRYLFYRYLFHDVEQQWCIKHHCWSSAHMFVQSMLYALIYYCYRILYEQCVISSTLI